MRHFTFNKTEGQTKFPICLLVPSIRADEIEKCYFKPYGLDTDDIVILDLHYAQGKKKTPKAEITKYINEELVPVLEDIECDYVLVADAEYFKVLTKTQRVDVNLGYVLDCAFGPQKIIYVPNYRTMFHDPETVTAKISQGITALLDHKAGIYQDPGTGIIKFEAYPKTLEEIESWLVQLLEMDKPLAIDIEAFSLRHDTAGIGTISFAWSKHEGIAFPVDYLEYGPDDFIPVEPGKHAPFGREVRNEPVRAMLKEFFKQYMQKAIYHHIAYDVYVLIYQLFMDDILDTEGLLEGLEVMLRNWEDTKLITYLATNSCAGNKLGLKDQAQEFAGNYAMGEDIRDIRNIPIYTLLRYNLVDSCSTWHVFEKNQPIMVLDDQNGIYQDIFKPAIVDIIQMQLTGMPINMRRVREVRWTLYKNRRAALSNIHNSAVAKEYTQHLNQKWVTKKNETLKVKRVTLADAKEVFNPGSPPQLQELLYELLGLPVLAYTNTRLPSTKAKDIEDLKAHTQDQEVIAFLDALLKYAAVDIILNTFIPAMLGAQPGPDGWHYLCGKFNLGGTLSGRLSSSDPNLQNLPASSTFAKLIKSCFEAPPGWLFVGLDFASLEDKISALTTKDPNKLKVYTDGYDGHSLRAYAYYTVSMPDIDPSSVESINSIQVKYKALRGKSKNPTFTLTYQGTWKTLVVKYGFTEDLAKHVEAQYHILYKVSDDWVAAKLDEASRVGYITAAFGLRVRTPLLHQVIRGNRRTPSEAEAEGRSAGNALGQSWCLLNSRAWSEFMGKVRRSNYRLDIRPCAQIHDAGYALLRDDLTTVAYMNKHLVEAVYWQDHPDIWHDQVKLGGELSIFWPTWNDEIIIPNEATEEQLPAVIQKALDKRNEKEKK